MTWLGFTDFVRKKLLFVVFIITKIVFRTLKKLTAEINPTARGVHMALLPSQYTLYHPNS
jgi:hypothetical protein